MFGLAHPLSDGLAVRRRFPPIALRHLRKLPDDIQAAHADWDRNTVRIDARDLERHLIDAGVPAHTAVYASEVVLAPRPSRLPIAPDRRTSLGGRSLQGPRADGHPDCGVRPPATGRRLRDRFEVGDEVDQQPGAEAGGARDSQPSSASTFIGPAMSRCAQGVSPTNSLRNSAAMIAPAVRAADVLHVGDVAVDQLAVPCSSGSCHTGSSTSTGAALHLVDERLVVAEHAGHLVPERAPGRRR